MAKKTRYLYFIWAMLICLGLYSLCAFLLASERGTVFWVTYNFSMLAIAAEFIVPFLLFQSRDIGSLSFLGLSPMVFTTVFAAVQLVLGVVLLLAQTGVKMAVILQAVMLGLYLLLLFAFLAGKSAIAEKETARQDAMHSIRTLTGKAEVLYSTATDPAQKALFKKVYEALLYTDPVSKGAEVLALDDAIQADLAALAEQARTAAEENLSVVVEGLLAKIQERAILCKSSK